MSGLNIDNLRLQIGSDGDLDYFGQRIADAQLAKALYGLKDWLMDFNSDYNDPVGDSVTELANAIEQAKIERRLVDLGVEILTRHQLVAVADGAVEMVETLKGATVTLNGTLVTVTARLPRDELYYELVADADGLATAGIQSVRRIGDCYGPATIAAAVYEGPRYARELDNEIDPDAVPFQRERFDLDSV